MQSRQSNKKLRSDLPAALIAVGYLLVLFISSKFWQHTLISTGALTLIPPSGLTLTMLILCGPVYAPVALFGYLGSVVIIGGEPWSLTIVAAAVTHTLVYTGAASLYRHIFKQISPFFSLRHTSLYVLIAIIASLLAALMIRPLLTWGGLITQITSSTTGFDIWSAETLGNLALTPFAIITLKAYSQLSRIHRGNWRARLRTSLASILIAFTQILLAAITLWMVFGIQNSDDRRMWYLLFLPLIWATLQFGFPGASAAVLLINIGSIMAVHNWGYALDNPDDLRVFMLLISMTGLMSGAAFSELRRVERALRARLAIEEQITSLSARFINLSAENMDAEIQNAMRDVAVFFDMDTSHLMLYSRDGRTVEQGYEWIAAGLPSRRPELVGKPTNRLPWLYTRLEQGKAVHFSSPDELPPEAATEKVYMKHRGIQSMVSAPIRVGERLAGSLDFHSQRVEREWAEEDVLMLTLLGEIFFNVLERRRSEMQARESDRKFRSIVMQSYDGISIMNELGQIVEWNRGMERISGLSRSQVLGQLIWDVQFRLMVPEQRTPETFAMLKNMMQQAMDGEFMPSMNRLTDTQMMRPDGARSIIQSLLFPVQSARGRLFGVITRDITELRAGQEELSLSRNRLAEAERLARLGHFQIEIPSGQMVWSEQAYRIFNWQPEEQLPELKKVMHMIHVDDRRRTIEMMDAVIQTKENAEIEFRLVFRDEIRYLHTVCRPLLDINGVVTHIFGTIMDISERKQAEDALLNSQMSYRELADSISDMFLSLDNNLCFTYWNPACERLTGISFTDAIGRSLFDVFPQLKGTNIEQIAMEAFRTREHQSFVMEFMSRSRMHYFDVNAYPSQSGLSVFLRDVTERQAAEDRLRQSEARYRAVVEDQSDLICRYLPDGTITFVNEAYCRSFGKARRDLVGTHFIRYMAGPNYTDMTGQHCDLRLPKPVTYEHQVVLSDTRTHWLQWTDRPILDDQGQVIEYQSAARDVTASKRLEEELRYLSTHDALTGIYNRLFFEGEMARIQRSRQYPVSVMMVDVNGLKRTNDTLGHQAGDELLARASRVLSTCFRPDDIVARFGGDEFAVLLPGIDARAARDMEQRVRNAVDTYNRFGDGPRLSLAIGMATSARGQSLTDLLTRADARMYQDKLHQKSSVEITGK